MLLTVLEERVHGIYTISSGSKQISDVRRSGRRISALEALRLCAIIHD